MVTAISHQAGDLLTTAIGFASTAGIFAGLLILVTAPVWFKRARLATVHAQAPDREHMHAHSVLEPPGDYQTHEHRHGDLVHSHPHRHDQPHSHE